MEKQKEFKQTKTIKSKGGTKLIKNNKRDTLAYGFILGLTGLLLVAISLSNPIYLFIGGLKFSYSSIGFILFIVGAWLTIRSTFD